MEFEDRLNKIEERLSAIEKRLGLYMPLKTPPPIPKTETPVNHWLKDNWLTAIGIFLVILSGSWFIGYAFANNWIGETARILLCIAAGAAVYIYGLAILKKQEDKGQIFLLLGGAVIMMSLYAGYQLYAILPALAVFALMAAVCAITTAIGLIYNLEGLSFASVIAAFIIPYLFRNNTIFLMSYVLLIDIAALLMLITKGWRAVFHAAWIGTLFYGFWFFQIGKKISSLFIAIFYLLFFLPSALSACSSKKGNFILFTSTLALIAWIAFFVPLKWQIASYSAAALLSLYFCYIYSKSWEPGKEYRTGTIFGFNAMAFILMAINSTEWPDIISYSIPIVIAMAVARYFFHSPTAVLRLPFFFIIPLALFLDRFPEILYSLYHHVDFATLCILASSFPIASWIVYNTEVAAAQSKFQKGVLVCLGVLSGLFYMALIWNICHQAIANDSIARGTALVIDIIAAEILIYMGNLKRLVSLRYGGIAIIVFVLCRLFLVEIWEMPVVIRTITFVATGLLLIATAWFDKRSKNLQI